jgi:hypothetical protein
MTVDWKVRKTKNRFSSLSTALANRCRDSHIPTAPTAGPLLSKPNPKGVLRYHTAVFTSGSFLDENMLRCVVKS